MHKSSKDSLCQTASATGKVTKYISSTTHPDNEEEALISSRLQNDECFATTTTLTSTQKNKIDLGLHSNDMNTKQFSHSFFKPKSLEAIKYSETNHTSSHKEHAQKYAHNELENVSQLNDNNNNDNTPTSSKSDTHYKYKKPSSIDPIPSLALYRRRFSKMLDQRTHLGLSSLQPESDYSSVCYNEINSNNVINIQNTQQCLPFFTESASLHHHQNQQQILQDDVNNDEQARTPSPINIKRYGGCRSPLSQNLTNDTPNIKDISYEFMQRFHNNEQPHFLNNIIKKKTNPIHYGNEEMYPSGPRKEGQLLLSSQRKKDIVAQYSQPRTGNRYVKNNNNPLCFSYTQNFKRRYPSHESFFTEEKEDEDAHKRISMSFNDVPNEISIDDRKTPIVSRNTNQYHPFEAKLPYFPKIINHCQEDINHETTHHENKSDNYGNDENKSDNYGNDENKSDNYGNDENKSDNYGNHEFQHFLSQNNLDISSEGSTTQNDNYSLWYKDALIKDPRDVMDDLIADQVTDVEIKHLSFKWTIKEFQCFRDHAYVAALPHMQNFIESREFGDEITGRWYLILFPNGEYSCKDVPITPSGGITIKVVSINKDSVTAKAQFLLLDAFGKEIPNTRRSFNAFKWFQTSLYYNSVCLCEDDEVDSLLACLSDGVLRLKCNLEICTNIYDVPDEHRITPKDIEIHSLENDLRHFCNDSLCKDIILYTNDDIKNDDIYSKNKRHNDNTHRPSSSSPFILKGKSLKHHHHHHDGIIASRFVLAARSNVLRTMLNSEFSEGRAKSLVFSDIEHETLENLVSFLHTDTCQLLTMRVQQQQHSEKYVSSLNCCDVDVNVVQSNSILTHKVILLLLAADKYDCPNLKLGCIQWLTHNLTLRTCSQILCVARQLQLKPLKYSCISYMYKNFPMHHALCNRESTKQSKIAFERRPLPLSISVHHSKSFQTKVLYQHQKDKKMLTNHMLCSL